MAVLIDNISIRTTCAECGTSLSGLNLNRRGNLFYCAADFQRLSPEEALQNHLLEVELEHYKLMFDGTGVINLIKNGDFATDTIWTKGTGWTISGGTATSDGTQSADSELSQPTPTKIGGAKYLYKFTTSDVTAGNIKIQQSASHFGTVRSTNGAFEETLTQIFPYSFNTLVANLDFVGSVDNFSVRRI